MICGSRGSKSRLAKAAGAEPAGQMRDEKLHPVVARSTFASEKAKSTSRSFGSWDVEKVHGVVARCTFRSQNARRYCAKHISKSKCTKHIKTLHARTTFGSWDVEKVHAVVARSTCRSQNVKNTRGSDHFWKLRCRKSARCCGAKHISKLTCEKNTRVRTTFGRSDVFSRGRRKGLWTLSKVSKTWGFCSIPKTMAGVGHLKRICNSAFSVAGAVQETCSSEKATVSCLTGSVSSSLASRCFFLWPPEVLAARRKHFLDFRATWHTGLIIRAVGESSRLCLFWPVHFSSSLASRWVFLAAKSFSPDASTS